MIQWEEVRHQVAIAGRVTDAQSKRALSGALIQITTAPAEFTNWLSIRALQYGSSWVTMPERPDRILTAADGHFHFLDLPNGQYKLTISLPDTGTRYGVAQVQAAVARNAQGKISMATADIALPPTTIKGKITGPGAATIAMARIYIQGSNEQTLSDDQGQYLLTGVETGKRTLLVSAQGFQSSSQTVTLGAAGAVQTLDFALKV